MERHVRRLWFRESPDEEWKQYAFNCVQFGDRPAATLMTISVEKASETYKEFARDLELPEDNVKEDSLKLLLDTYIDDGTMGGTRRQVSRMMGTKLADGSYSGTIPSMLKKVGLKLKTIVSSNSHDKESMDK